MSSPGAHPGERSGNGPPRAAPLRARALMRPYALIYFYRRRLRVHAPQELLAGFGVAVAVALVFATLVAAGTIAGSADEVVHAVIGPANLQLRARGADGIDERLLARVERLPAVRQAAPLLEQTATIVGPHGRRATVDLAGADTSLVVLDGLAHTLPIATLAPGGLGLSRTTAAALGIPARLPTPGPAASTPVARPPAATEPVAAPPPPSNPSNQGAAASAAAGEGPAVTLQLRGRAHRLGVSAVLGPETFGALSQAGVAVMPLRSLQRLAGLDGRVSRILVRARPGELAAARAQLRALAGGALTVAAADQDVAALRQALRPSDQASAFFAAIAALLGLLFAFNALLLTVPERRRAIADLRLIGTRRPAIAQMLIFQALCLGVVASLVGLLGGYALSRGVFHQSPRYLAEAFTLGTRTVVQARPLALAFLGGVLACCLASAVPLLDLRRGGALDAVYREAGVPGNALGDRARRTLALAAVGLLALASALFALAPALALLACAVLALATVLAVPLTFAALLGAARAFAERRQRLTLLPVALSSLRATSLRSIALAATGAVAIFGSVALGGARGDLLRGIRGFAHSYAADAPIWVGSPGDNQATVDFQPGGVAGRIAHGGGGANVGGTSVGGDGREGDIGADGRAIARVPGVASVRAFQGGFLDLGNRRVWVIARPPGGAQRVLESQIAEGSASVASARLGEGGWIAVSKQIADERHLRVGGLLTLPTPSGAARLRIAATTTNLAWSPGAVFIGSADYRRLWASSAPTAFGVQVAGGANVLHVQRAIERALGPGSGLAVTTAREREASIDALTGEGLGQLGEISTLLLIAAILALAAALTSAIWQRRVSLAALRLSGVRARRLRLILAIESALILGAGCLTGAVAGIYGQAIIDGYLAHVTGFPVAPLGASLRPLEILALVTVLVLAIAAIPGWLASRVSPILALNE